MGHHRRYTPEFKQRAVELRNPRETAYAEVARELGADDGTLAKWVRLVNNERRGPWWPICPLWRLCSTPCWSSRECLLQCVCSDVIRLPDSSVVDSRSK